MSHIQEDRGFNTVEAAGYLGISRKTLEDWRWRRLGPAYARLGRRVIYRKADLDAFVESRKVNPDALNLKANPDA